MNSSLDQFNASWSIQPTAVGPRRRRGVFGRDVRAISDSRSRVGDDGCRGSPVRCRPLTLSGPPYARGVPSPSDTLQDTIQPLYDTRRYYAPQRHTIHQTTAHQTLPSATTVRHQTSAATPSARRSPPLHSAPWSSLDASPPGRVLSRISDAPAPHAHTNRCLIALHAATKLMYYTRAAGQRPRVRAYRRPFDGARAELAQ